MRPRHLILTVAAAAAVTAGCSKRDDGKPSSAATGDRSARPSSSSGATPAGGDTTPGGTPSALAAGRPGAAPANDLAAVATGDWADRLLQVALGAPDCAARVPALEAYATEAEQGGQPVWAAEALVAVASCQAGAQQAEDALAHLQRAVALGYADCYFVRTDPGLTSLEDQQGYAAATGQMTLTMADVRELAWLTAEFQTILHDTNMMITENMNRVDGDFTVVPASAAPTRATANQSVAAGRVMLAALQRYQQAMVFQADKQRIEHNTTMAVIDSMGDPSGRDSPRNVQQSRLLAQQAAQQRAAAVDARAFSAGDASTERVRCSDIPD
ncbi:MAG: hypothetical protein H6709_07320 [Kofleriaceae bacterium]|nr:hypothetical protein [Kofleriaceae bacterium]MCB9571889.1 hypothetical protein [Kofleriaceae bacterium]